MLIKEVTARADQGIDESVHWGEEWGVPLGTEGSGNTGRGEKKGLKEFQKKNDVRDSLVWTSILYWTKLKILDYGFEVGGGN